MDWFRRSWLLIKQKHSLLCLCLRENTRLRFSRNSSLKSRWSVSLIKLTGSLCHYGSTSSEIGTGIGLVRRSPHLIAFAVSGSRKARSPEQAKKKAQSGAVFLNTNFTWTKKPHNSKQKSSEIGMTHITNTLWDFLAFSGDSSLNHREYGGGISHI